jgi:hypothetical protein
VARVDPVDGEGGDAREHRRNVRISASRVGHTAFQFCAGTRPARKQDWNSA